MTEFAELHLKSRVPRRLPTALPDIGYPAPHRTFLDLIRLQ